MPKMQAYLTDNKYLLECLFLKRIMKELNKLITHSPIRITLFNTVNLLFGISCILGIYKSRCISDTYEY